MGETRGKQAGEERSDAGRAPGSARDRAAALGRLRQQILGLADADVLLVEEGQGLLATLDRALQGLTAGEGPTVRLALQGFLAQWERLVETGDLAPGEGQPAVETARVLLAALDGAAGDLMT